MNAHLMTEKVRDRTFNHQPINRINTDMISPLKNILLVKGLIVCILTLVMTMIWGFSVTLIQSPK